MLRRRKTWRFALAALAVACCAGMPAVAAVMPGGDTTLAATSSDTTYVGKTGMGTLEITDSGTLANSSGYLGFNKGSGGTAAVSGSGSTWTNSGGLTVGHYGMGTLNIDSGGQVSNLDGLLGLQGGASGTATVSGSGSKWNNSGSLTVGHFGSGTLSVGSGGQVSNGLGRLGYFTNSSGSATVSGDGSKWINSYALTIGYGGSGSLSIDSGGQVSSQFGYLGDLANSSGAVTVSGPGSTWTNQFEVRVGRSGSGSLTVSDGGLVTAQTLYASLSDLHGNGAINVGGAVLDADLLFDSTHGQSVAFGTGGTLNLNLNGSTGNLGVGYKGTGSLRVADGKTLSVSTGYLGYFTSSSGSAIVSGSGSTWTNNHQLYVGAGGNGSLTVSDGGLVNARTLYASLSDLHGNGIIVANGTVLDADLVLDSTHDTTQTIPFGSGGRLNVNFNGSGSLGAGHTGNGSLMIAEGKVVQSSTGEVGSSNGSSGVATVSGTGSSWVNTYNLNVGNAGAGTLRIRSGGKVSNKDGYLGYGSGSSGTATVSGSGSMWASSGILYVGSAGTGTLNINSGGQVNSQVGKIGQYSDGNTATVRGANSNWTMSGHLYVGDSGSGVLLVDSGGQVSNGYGYLGYTSGSSGTATVSGSGSKWTSSGSLYVGNGGQGSLAVADNGTVTAKSLSIKSNSVVRIHVSGSDMLVLGNATATGTVTNNGMISFCADPFLPANTYRPISAYPGKTITWSGTGSYAALGGIWNATARTFTVSPTTAILAGESDTLTSGERLVITDPDTGRHVGVSVGTVAGPPTFSASPLDLDHLDSLPALPGPNDQILSAWDFATTLPANTETLLSFDVGLDASDFSIWRYSNNAWSAYTPSLLTCDSAGHLSFTVTSFSAYAVAAAVPEPGCLTLLPLGALLLRRRRR